MSWLAALSALARLILAVLEMVRERKAKDAGRAEGVGRVYQQTFVDTYAKVGFAKTPMQTFLDALPIAQEKCLPVKDGGQPAVA